MGSPGFKSGLMRKVKSSYIGDCVKALRKYGILAWATKNTNFVTYLLENGEMTPDLIFPASGIDGLGDVTGILPGGRRLDIACLKPRQGDPGARRTSFLNKMNKRGGVAIYVNSVRHMVELLQELGYCEKEESEENDGEKESRCGLCPPQPQAAGVDPTEISEGGSGNCTSGDSGGV